MSKWTNKTLRTVKDWPLEIVEAGEEEKPIGGSVFEGDDREIYAHPIISINHNRLSTFAHKLTDKEEAKALARRVVETFNACTGISFVGDSEGVVGEMVKAMRASIDQLIVNRQCYCAHLTRRWIDRYGTRCGPCMVGDALSRVEVKGDD